MIHIVPINPASTPSTLLDTSPPQLARYYPPRKKQLKVLRCTQLWYHGGYTGTCCLLNSWNFLNRWAYISYNGTSFIFIRLPSIPPPLAVSPMCLALIVGVQRSQLLLRHTTDVLRALHE